MPETGASMLFLLHNGEAYPALDSWGRKRPDLSLNRLIRKLTSHLKNRRNPRTLLYMEQLAKSTFAGFESGKRLVISDPTHFPKIGCWASFREIVLLWPDANGTGWTKIEREVLRAAAPATRVLVLNGRRRLFVLTRATWWSFRWRRLLEKSLVPELAFTAAFLAVTPWLALWDRLHGRS